MHVVQRLSKAAVEVKIAFPDFLVASGHDVILSKSSNEGLTIAVILG